MFSTATATQSLAFGWALGCALVLSCRFALNTLHLSMVTTRNNHPDGIFTRMIFPASLPLASVTVAVIASSYSGSSILCISHPFLVYGSIHLFMSSATG